MPDSTLTPDQFMAAQKQAPGALTPDAFMAAQAQKPQPSSTAQQPGFFQGLWDTVNPLPAIEHYAQLGKQEQDAIKSALQKGDYKTAAANFAKSLPGVDLATDLGKAQAEQFHKAYQDLKLAGQTQAPLDAAQSVISAGGHALAGVLPVIGPAAANAGENLGTPGRAAYGAGQAVGQLMPYAAGLVRAAPVVEAIRAEPEVPVNELLAQTTKKGQRLLANRGEAVQAAGLTGPAADVKAQTAATLARVGPQIGAEAERISALGTMPDVQKMHDAIQGLRDANTSSNGVPFNPAYDARLSKAQDQLLDIRTNPKGESRFSDYDNLLNEWQKEAKASYLNPDAAAGAQSMKAASAKMREILRNTEGTDTLNALHDEFAANKAANDLATLARPKPPKLGPVGQAAVKLSSMGAGGIVGSMLGHPYAGALAATVVAPQLEKLIMSGSVRRMPATLRNSIADSLASGNITKANQLAILGTGTQPEAAATAP